MILKYKVEIWIICKGQLCTLKKSIMIPIVEKFLLD